MRVGNLEVYGVIYKITNKINGKVYIGQTTVGFNKRYSGNIYNSTHNSYLKNSIVKYGMDNFDICEIFDVAFSKSELDIKEILNISYFRNKNGVYNMTLGGQRGGDIRKFMTKENYDVWRNKLSEAHKGKKLKEEHIEKIRSKNIGKIRSDEYKEFMSNKMLGNKSNKGKKFDKDWCNKISESHKGNFNPMYGKFGADNPTSKKVICLTTMEVFDSVTIASKYINRSVSHVTACCRGRKKSAGIDPLTGEKLIWMYYEEYIGGNK